MINFFAQVASDGIVKLTPENITLGGIAFAAITLLVRWVDRLIVSRVSPKMGGTNGARDHVDNGEKQQIREIHHAITARDGVIGKEHGRHAELLLTTSQVLDRVANTLDRLEQRQCSIGKRSVK